MQSAMSAVREWRAVVWQAPYHEGVGSKRRAVEWGSIPTRHIEALACRFAIMPQVLKSNFSQSTWIKFDLPDWVMHGDELELIEVTQHVRLEAGMALHSDEVDTWCVVDTVVFRMPKDDTELLYDSHTTGLYAWDAGEDAHSSSFGKLMVVYLHFAYLLPTLPDTVLPQRLCGQYSLGTCNLLSEEAFIWCALDFHSVHQGRLGHCIAQLRVSDESHGALHGVGGFAHLLPGIMWCGSPSHMWRCTGTGPCDWEMIEDLEDILGEDHDVLIDLAVYLGRGSLLLARAGLELWNYSDTCRAHFMLDQPRTNNSTFMVQNFPDNFWSNGLWMLPTKGDAQKSNLGFRLSFEAIRSLHLSVLDRS